MAILIQLIQLIQPKKWIYDWILLSFFFISGTILAVSFYYQYVAKIEPCSLCKWQRLLYGFVFFILPIGTLKKYNQYIKHALKFLFFSIACLSIYHALVQFGWISDHCIINANIETMDDFMQMLSQPKISCAEITWQLFKIPASIWSAVISLCSLLILLKYGNKFPACN
jgi:disulfide bond formation protein DsbB